MNAIDLNIKDCVLYYFSTNAETRPIIFNPLNTELNPICHLLALLGAHHIFHVSGIRVKLRFIY